MYNIDGVTCNACRTINAINRQTTSTIGNSYGGGGESNPIETFVFILVFLAINVLFNFWPLRILWFYVQIFWCLVFGWWTNTCP
jgi:hypothetical protein